MVAGVSGRRNAPLIGDQPDVRLSMVRCRWRGTSPSPASGFQGGAIAPLIDGCRESEVSLLVVERRNALMALDGVNPQ